MDPELEAFIKDHIESIHERYNYALIQNGKSKTPADVAFLEGASFAYYDVLKRLQAQLERRGHDLDALGPIIPELGEPIWKKDQD